MKISIENLIKTLAILFVIDFIWIKLVAQRAYKKIVRDVQKEELQIKIIPAIFAYISMTLLLVIFSSESHLKNFFLGLLTYSVYDTTNLALFKNFDPKFAIADVIWGGVLFMTSGYLMHLNK